MHLSLTTSLYLFKALIKLNIINSEAPSYSDKWNLHDKQRHKIREEGYCAKLCGIGFDTEADGWDAMIRHYHKRKSYVEYYEFDMALEGEFEDHSVVDFESLYNEDLDEEEGNLLPYPVVDKYCAITDLSFEECNDLEYYLRTEKSLIKCLDYCKDNIDSQIDSQSIDFNDISPDRQRFETCLDSFMGPHEFFNYQNKTQSTVSNMVNTLRRNGFITITNFFPRSLMNNVTSIMTSWEDSKKWNNLEYIDFFSNFSGQLSEYENRLEIVLPYTEPFSDIMWRVHNSSLMEVMREYSGHRPINADFPASIMSRPGALQQDTHGDHGVEAGMIKLSIAIHDIHEKSGPTSLCPCTHQFGIQNSLFNKKCGIRYHPKLIPAGSITLYDQCMKHRGSANNGDIRRYILDLSYNVDQVFNTYEKTYPHLAQEHILRYREDFQRL